ncbi:hypothetical protein [Sporosarcina sp. YIM B06819]|uniref:hypothetical protein n=1 Tax=Sporosarcina sp. YIM B06819 TaxID=3081769 RepID=UPI00298C4650|nr:hypothetical protein [Sporosarcina sp. YIM B06819]
MEELKRRLTKEIQQDFNVKILESLSWNLPVHTIEIAYQTVKRTQMDILMKMMLLAFQTEEIADAEELSDILLVEQLFINDLIDKMSRTGVLDTKGNSFVLTEAGNEQLDSGIFAHEPEDGTKEALYSPCHETFLTGNLEACSSVEGQETYRYHKEYADWTVKSLAKTDAITALQSLEVESSEGNTQIVISKIVSATNVQTDAVLCLEFRLYNKAEDVLYARVWNTLLGHWDKTLEAQINEQERKEWRESYLSEFSPRPPLS